MNLNTVVRVRIPISLYESIKGKVLNVEAFVSPRQKAFDILETLRDLGVTDSKILEYILGNIMNGFEAEEAMKNSYGEFVGDVDDEDLQEAKKPVKKVVEDKKKPSAGLTKKAKSTIVKKAEAGKNIGKGGFAKVAAKAAKEYGSKESGKKVAAAAMWKNKAKKAK